MDLLLKLSHDPDLELVYRSIISLGFIGAGTNNSRIADILHGLSSYNAKDANGMFLVRIA
jgi:26S proteasome regulatory subunit N1